MEPVTAPSPLRPAEFSRQLLRALDASEGRTRRRKRDQTPDTIGLNIKRALLMAAAAADPAPDAFEAWLMGQALAGDGSGASRAMSLEILEEYRLAALDPAFHTWLQEGAHSADADGSEPLPFTPGARRDSPVSQAEDASRSSFPAARTHPDFPLPPAGGEGEGERKHDAPASDLTLGSPPAAGGETVAAAGVCQVELLGTARLQAGTRYVAIDLPQPATLGQVVAALAERCPALAGPVLDCGRAAPVAGYVFSRNGRDFLLDPGAPVAPGDRLLLLSSLAGG